MPKPAFAGGLLLGLGVAFFLAATNTLAGWLFVISGLILALLLISWWVARRQVGALHAEALPLQPVMAHSDAQITVQVRHDRPLSLTLFQVVVPFGIRPQGVLELPPQVTLPVNVPLKPLRRGLYDWSGVGVQTAAPFGLLWVRRWFRDPQRLVVYPRVVRVTQCPLLQEGLADRNRSQAAAPLAQAHLATEGTTRALRPYRRGDPLRYIHWRTSARYGELRTRELESQREGQPLVFLVDHRPGWPEDAFEQALSAVVSLYRWAQSQDTEVQIRVDSGSLTGERAILTALAGLAANATTVTAPEEGGLWFTWDPNRASYPLIHPEAPRGWWLIWHPHYLWLDPGQDLGSQLGQMPRSMSL